jgi:hypothetical protein
MSFVRSKVINGCGPYYYKVENRWVPGKGSRQRVIRYLGRNPGGLSTKTVGDHANVAPNTSHQGANQDADQPSTLAHETIEARDEINESAKDAREILAKNEAQRTIIDDTDAPESRKELVKRERTKKAADQLRAEKVQAQRSLDDFHKEVLEASKRSREKWSAQRKKEAKATADRVGCSTIQADALNQRAKRAGRQYDEVDFDQLQGKDLQYSERVAKLDQQLGVSTRTKGEAGRSSKHFDAAVSKWEANPEAYQGELEAASREMFYDMKAEAY